MGGQHPVKMMLPADQNATNAVRRREKSVMEALLSDKKMG